MVKFELLIRQPESTSQGALDALRLGLIRGTNAETPAFDQLHEKDPKFFRAGRVGQRQGAMTNEGMRLAGYVR